MSSLMMMGAGNEGEGTWTTVYDGGSGNANQTAWGTTTTIAQVIDDSLFSQTGGTQIRITFTGPSSGDPTIMNALWIGNGGGGDAYDFTGDQVQLQVSGSNIITVPVGGTVTTDPKAFIKDNTNPIVIAFDLRDAGGDDVRTTATGGTGGFYYKSSGDAASVQNKAAGWASLGTNTVALKIELLI